MWQLDENASQTFNFWYVMILQILFLVGNTMFATPLVGLGYEMTSDYNERTRLMSLANCMGQIAWMIVPWLYVIIPDANALIVLIVIFTKSIFVGSNHSVCSKQHTYRVAVRGDGMI